MPFKSKAQQRWMFATSPEKAKQWADETKNIKGLPEKKQPQVNPKKKNLPPMEEKKASEGLFFEKRSQPEGGNFFRDMAGREDANFHEKSAQAGMGTPGAVPSGAGMNVSPMKFGTGDAMRAKASTMKPGTTSFVDPGATGMPPGNAGEPGQAQGGGMYGAGEGADDPSEETTEKQNEADVLKALLGKAVAEGGGEERKANGGEEEKTATVTPNDWDAGVTGLPTGFHRPASEQPEALEPGGERFHSTEANAADYGSGEGISHGLVEAGKMRMKATSGHQMGKHASAYDGPPRFLGTPYAMTKEAGVGEYAAERGGEYGSSLKGLGKSILRTADEGVKAVSRSGPLSALLTFALLRGGVRGTKGLAKRLRKAPPKPPSKVEQLAEGAKSVGRRLGIIS
jgi:hypothetical protein